METAGRKLPTANAVHADSSREFPARKAAEYLTVNRTKQEE